MKNRFFSIFPSFEVAADGGGGGTAVAAPPAVPAAAAPPAPIATRPAGPGMFGGGKAPIPDLKKPAAEPAVEPAKVEPNAAEPTAEKFQVIGEDGNTLGEFATQAEADAFAKSQTKTPIAADPESLARPGMGRFKTLREFEDGYRRTEVEAQRLFQENRTLRESTQKDIADRDAKLELMKAELEEARTTPPFKEFSKEELDALAKENPLAAVEYVAEKKLRDRDAKAAKERKETEIRSRQEQKQDVLRRIEEHSKKMSEDKENYPQYADMIPLMDEMRERMTYKNGYNPITGHAWSGEALYLMSMGKAYLQSLKGGTRAVADAAAAAKAKAEADARTVRSPSSNGKGSGGTVVLSPSQKDHQDWRSKVIGSAPKSVFGGVGKPK